MPATLLQFHSEREFKFHFVQKRGAPVSECLIRLAAGMHSFCKTETEFAVSAAGITAASGDADDKPVSDLITGFCCLLMVKETGA